MSQVSSSHWTEQVQSWGPVFRSDNTSMRKTHSYFLVRCASRHHWWCCWIYGSPCCGRAAGLGWTSPGYRHRHIKYIVMFPADVLKMRTGSDRRRINLIGAGVHCSQPAEEALISSGRVLARCPVPGHVIRVGDHQFSTVEVSTQNKWDVLHPVDDRPGLWRHLMESQSEDELHSVYTHLSFRHLSNWLCFNSA